MESINPTAEKESAMPAKATSRTQGKGNAAPEAAKGQSANGAAHAASPSVPQKPTVSHMLGEMTWLLQQSPLHRHFSIADLEWMIMPPLMLERYRIFRGNPNPLPQSETGEGEEAKPGTTPMGLALWAMLSAEAEQKLNAMVMGGKGPVKLRPDEWRSGDRLWLIDLIAPFATAENKLAQVMLADLMHNGLKHVLPKARGKVLKLHKADPKTGKREVVEVRGA